MSRTTIHVPEVLLKRLRLIATERGSSLTVVIREALEERPEPRAWR